MTQKFNIKQPKHHSLAQKQLKFYHQAHKFSLTLHLYFQLQKHHILINEISHERQFHFLDLSLFVFSWNSTLNQLFVRANDDFVSVIHRKRFRFTCFSMRSSTFDDSPQPSTVIDTNKNPKRYLRFGKGEKIYTRETKMIIGWAGDFRKLMDDSL